MYILRILLIFLIVYLIVRAFIIAGSGEKRTSEKTEPAPDKNNYKPPKGVPKSIGEYIDYEEADNRKA